MTPIIVPIRDNTVDLIAAMNDGIRPYVDPKIEKIFVYNGKHEMPNIDYYFNIDKYLSADDARSTEVTFFQRR